jgi:hypothetical protein
MKKWITIAGYVILIFSCILWALILVIPWLGLSKGKIAGIMAMLIVAGEITFYMSVIILGKSIIIKIKKHLMFWKKKN